MCAKFKLQSKRTFDGHYVEHQSPPAIWQDGFPLGNGFLGAMVWGDGHPLNFTLDCADLWDNRTAGAVVDNPAYNYANLCRLIKNKKFDEADRIFGGAGNKIPARLFPTKISIGRVELDIGAVRDYTGRLDVDRAVVEGRLTTQTAHHDFTAFVSKTRHVLCVKIKNMPKRARLKLRPLMEICPAMAGLEFPPPEYMNGSQIRNPAVAARDEGGSGGFAPGRQNRAQRARLRQMSMAMSGFVGGTQRLKDIHIMAQTIPDGLSYAVAWNIAGDDIFIAVETGATVMAAADQAAATLNAAVHAGFEKIYRDHVRAWGKFWRASSVMLPEPMAEFYWHYGVYLLASSAQRGHMPPGLQGVWAMDGVLPPWRGDYHNDMNVQETFWPAGVSGHIDLLDCWCDYMLERLPVIQKYTRRVFGTAGTFWPCVLFGKADPGGMGGSNWYALCFAWSHGLWLGWLVWLRWRYSMDVNWLRDTGYPLLAEILTFVRANLVAEADGCLHVPVSSSPEYRGHKAREAFCKDPNIDLALIRKCCDWIMEMEAALGISKLTRTARKIRKTLAPYALSEKHELCLWPGKLLDESHRHPSQLMAVHPAMDLTIDGDDQARAIITASVNQYLGLGQFHWAGHTYAQMISMAAVLGRGEWAYDCLRQFTTRWTMPNGLHVNADWRGTGASYFGVNINRDRRKAPFTMEANNAVSAGIGDMLVQGWGDKLRVFPAMPAHWREAAFFGLVAEGGWQVSAVRHQGRTVWVRVTAGVSRRLTLADPFDGAPVRVEKSGKFVVNRKNGVYTSLLKKGQVLILSRRGYRMDKRGIIADIRTGNTSLLGLPVG